MEMCHAGVDIFAISRPCARAPDKTAIIVEDRAQGFTVLILQVSHVFKRTSNVSN